MKKTLILTAAAIPTGVIVGAVDALFGRVLLYLGAVRDAHTAWFLPFLGVVGALMAWAYKKYGAGCENGMGMVFEAGHADREDIPLQLVPFVMCATWLTHLFGGSAGREGVAVQLGAAISHRVGRLLRVEDAPRLMLITGISAGFAGLFRTPFAATAFAMEVLTVGRLEHRALLPAAVAALCASATSGALGLEKFEFAVAAPAEWDALLLAKLAVLGVIFGLVGAVFAFCLRNAKKMAQNRLKNPVLRAFCMGLALSVVLYALYRGRYCGLGTNLINVSLSGETVYAWDWALKLADRPDAGSGLSGRRGDAAVLDRSEPGRRARERVRPAGAAVRRAWLRRRVRLREQHAPRPGAHRRGGLRLGRSARLPHRLRRRLCGERQPVYILGPEGLKKGAGLSPAPLVCVWLYRGSAALPCPGRQSRRRAGRRSFADGISSCFGR